MARTANRQIFLFHLRIVIWAEKKYVPNVEWRQFHRFGRAEYGITTIWMDAETEILSYLLYSFVLFFSLFICDMCVVVIFNLLLVEAAVSSFSSLQAAARFWKRNYKKVKTNTIFGRSRNSFCVWRRDGSMCLYRRRDFPTVRTLAGCCFVCVNAFFGRLNATCFARVFPWRQRRVYRDECKNLIFCPLDELIE